MKVTAALCKVHKGFWFKKLWEAKSKYIEPELVVPKVLLNKNVTIHDPTKEPPPPAWQPPVPNDPRYPPEPAAEQAGCEGQQLYVHSASTRLWEGVKQAEVLTKSMVMKRDGLPQPVLEKLGRLSLPDDVLGQDVAVQRCIFQANLWDPTSVTLPRRPKPEDLSVWEFKAESGIPAKRSMELLVGNLLRLCFMAGGATAGDRMLLSRKLVEDHHLTTSYVFERSTIQITGTSKWAIMGSTATPPFVGDELLINSTSKHNLPDLFPVFPTLDLEKAPSAGRQDDVITTPLSGKIYSHPHVHTAVILHDNDWSDDQRDANAIIGAFGYCVAAAKARYGNDMQGRLPQPVAVHCVRTDGIQFNSICFQLNTMDFSSPTGIKNLVWIDKPQKLFEKLVPKRAMLRNTRYENYNPAVFRNLLAIFSSGASI